LLHREVVIEGNFLQLCHKALLTIDCGHKHTKVNIRS
jgi:hypothetical protein